MLKYVNINDLIRMKHKNNPKMHNLELTKLSILEYGFNSLIVINEGTLEILSGNGRTTAIHDIKMDFDAGKINIVPQNIVVEQGNWMVPCLYVNYKNYQDAFNYLVADNVTNHVLSNGLQDMNKLVLVENIDEHKLPVGISEEDYLFIKGLLSNDFDKKPEKEEQPEQKKQVFKITIVINDDEVAFIEEVINLLEESVGTLGEKVQIKIPKGFKK